MNNSKKLAIVISTLIICAFSMTGCEEGGSGQSSVSEADSVLSAENASALSAESNNKETGSEYFDSDDLNDTYDDITAVISFTGDSADINGGGAEFSDGRIIIESGGTFLFSGTLYDGQIYVNTKDKVHLVFNGVKISNSVSSAVYIENADKAVITVAEGSENNLSDAADYVYDNSEENEPDAVIYSKDDLSVNGGGTLNITANYNEGITSKNDLRIKDSVINITSVGNSIKGKDSLAIMEAKINAQSQSDGLKSSNAEEDGKGYIAIESGEFNITAVSDAIQAETELIINGGTFDIKTGNGSGDTNAASSDQIGRGFGRASEGNSNKTEDSEKGVKAGNKLIINDGTITADCTDDTVHSNGNIEINGGTLNLSSGDDGIHADGELTVNGGEISVLKSYEGMEGTVITINDGNISVTASDDGFNASEGSADDDAESSGQNIGKGFGDVSENCILNINGGYIYVNAGGDGLDSNGVMNISGGTVIVDGPVNDGNGALDSGTEINVSGGILIAAGSSGMAEFPSDTSTQPSLVVGFEQSLDAGTIVCVQNKNGENIITYSPSKKFSSVIISSPDIIQGESYSIYYGGSSSGTAKDGLYSGGEYSGGTLLETVTAESAVTQAGTGTFGQMGGIGRGGMPGNNGSFDPENGEMPDNGFTHPEGMTPPNGGSFDNVTPPAEGYGFDEKSSSENI